MKTIAKYLSRSDLCKPISFPLKKNPKIWIGSYLKNTLSLLEIRMSVILRYFRDSF
ncbi:hypothetical protein LEP1GSC123_2984 [Leptospira borgpetersenii str. 200701203]|uniref:Uncharacterized protein n=1 Tax=Leptospira borgpetersenii str. 200701203 TaxID=1193007 RepID=M3HQJ5_LEPBO|nr:hypothetical protein LEP1GSC123_2984 [Leptospira borgpetersenii str. 200701203]